MRPFIISLFVLFSSLSFGQVAAMLMVPEPETGGVTYLLDDYPADAAYSLRLLKADHADSSAIRVRRSSDNAEQDIGFTVEGYLDTASLKTFVGANSGYVTTWYDQSGNELDATQSTAASQAIIVNSGAVVRRNGLVTLDMDSGNYIIGTGNNFNEPTIFTVIDHNANEQYIISLQSNNNNGWRQHLRTSDFRTRVATVNLDITSGTGYNLFTSLISDPTSFVYYDSSNSASISTSPTANVSTYELQIGSSTSVVATLLDAFLYEIILYNSDQSANKTSIESNINTHYSIY